MTDLLVSDLEWMVAQWAPGAGDNYRAQLTAADANEVFRRCCSAWAPYPSVSWPVSA